MEAWTGGDAGRHYLQLTQNEEDLLEAACSRFGTVIVILNTPVPMEADFLSDERIDAALWIGEPGGQGFRALAGILSGRIAPEPVLTSSTFWKTAEGRNGTATSAQRAFTADTAIMRPDSRMPGQMIRMDWRPGRRLWHFLLDTG